MTHDEYGASQRSGPHLTAKSRLTSDCIHWAGSHARTRTGSNEFEDLTVRKNGPKASSLDTSYDALAVKFSQDRYEGADLDLGLTEEGLGLDLGDGFVGMPAGPRSGSFDGPSPGQNGSFSSSGFGGAGMNMGEAFDGQMELGLDMEVDLAGYGSCLFPQRVQRFTGPTIRAALVAKTRDQGPLCLPVRATSQRAATAE